MSCPERRIELIVRYLEKRRPASNKGEANAWFFTLVQARALQKEIAELKQDADIVREQYTSKQLRLKL